MSRASRGFEVSGFALVAVMAATLTSSSDASALKRIQTPEQREAANARAAAHPDGFTACTHYPGGATSAVSCGMQYQSGQVISNVQVVPVFWTYGGKTVDSNVTTWAPPYISALVDSPFLDLMSEYSTASQGGSQTVTRGTTLAARTIVPTVATAATVPDSDISKELAAQVKAGKLPAVTNDSGGNPNTLYVIFFAPGNTITMGSGQNVSTSCTDFCGYHGSGVQGSATYVYAVIPDLSVVQTYTLSDGGTVTEPCGYGCAYDPKVKPEVDWFNGTISHEIGEAVSDPINFGGWYDQSNSDYACGGSQSQNQPGGGEIGDVCVGFWDDEYGSGECEDTVTVPGTNVQAQQMWSNALNGCYVNNTATTPKCPPGGCVDGGAGPVTPGFDAGGGASDASTGGDATTGGDDGGGTGSDDASLAQDSTVGNPLPGGGDGGGLGVNPGDGGGGGGGGGSGGASDGGSGTAPASSSGCSCTNAASTTSSSFGLGGALMAIAALVRRRSRRNG